MIYKSILNEHDTEHAIKLVKDTFQQQLAGMLKLRRVTAPLFVKSGIGINDDLNGWEKPVSFTTFDNTKCEIVHSLAKWKRMRLAKDDFKDGYGLYTDMNAIRPDETPDFIHSIYVDQWDWEKPISNENRCLKYLIDTVKQIYTALKNTENIVCDHYNNIFPFLPDNIVMVHSQVLRNHYPNLTPKEREYEFAKKFGAIFVIGIGKQLSDGLPHDNRAADYDDWALNCDILIYCPWLDKVIELSSMGIRVDAESLRRQLKIVGHEEWSENEYHAKVLNNELPLTIGGGIGQSRLCMILLHKAHIGEVQASIWPDEEIKKCKENGIKLI